MQPTRVRVVQSPTVGQLEETLNATLAELEAASVVAGIEAVTYHPSMLGSGAILTAMIVYRLAPPVAQEAAAVAEAEAIIADDPLPETELAS